VFPKEKKEKTPSLPALTDAFKKYSNASDCLNRTQKTMQREMVSNSYFSKEKRKENAKADV
jgi:hypothetical protein